jgi:hypothetical protein
MAQLDAALPGGARVPATPSRTEADLARAALRLLVPLGLVVMTGAGVLRGTSGLLTAAFVLALVVGLFVLTALAHAWAAARGVVVFQAVVLAALLARLGLYGVLLVVLRPLEVLDPLTLVVATPVVVIALLTHEVRYVSSRREFLFLDLDARIPTTRKDRS